ncbi:AfsR/SARP family transcriptional regulator [Streptomyces sp. PT12]|uniref:AfsR/SARP family transcriptional regulator n=1 Tax=Streptomyces sp. PT12 TaxID=1510197 RepID=UPI000DE260EC|nr:AfsR/SARP family transcriptional regulator [Streptomyces sp. PT12]RBM18587.1 hypothetical protein DEH69_12985 [Streptomyces sp. PT12]
MNGGPLRLGVLGDIAAWRGAEPLDIGHARQRHVLGALLLEPGTAVPGEELARRVWGARPPRGTSALYGYVSRLRRALAGGGADIVRDRAGYRLEAEAGPAAVDVCRFRALVVRAGAVKRDEEAAALWDEALGQWRGEAFAGADAPWFRAQRERLDAERLAARLDAADVALRLGRQGALLGELAARAGDHPLDERMAGQLILALHREGRHAEALASFERVRLRLAEELGLDPGPALRRLRERLANA